MAACSLPGARILPASQSLSDTGVSTLSRMRGVSLDDRGCVYSSHPASPRLTVHGDDRRESR